MKIKKPQMILFDYGQTLFSEQEFDGVAGTRALLAFAIKNPLGKTAEQIQSEADKLDNELGRYDMKSPVSQVEITAASFQQYLYGSCGIEFSIPIRERESVFWDHSSPGKPTDGVAELLDYLKHSGIRTGVVSNISYSGQSLKKRIKKYLPNNNFDFIIASSEYVFRKPNRRIFDLACFKSGLSPDEIWFCGDQYAKDIVGSRSAGMFPILYTGASGQPQAVPNGDGVVSISNWEELAELLKHAE